MTGKVKEIESEQEFNDTLRNSGDKLVVIDFFATWCGPCQMCAPQYAALSTKYTNVIFLKVDVDKQRNVAAKCGVRAMPTFMLYKNNTKLTEFSGADMNKLESLILQYGDTFQAFAGEGRSLGSSGKPFANPWKTDQPPIRKEPPKEKPVEQKSIEQPKQQEAIEDGDDDLDEDLKKAIELSKQEAETVNMSEQATTIEGGVDAEMQERSSGQKLNDEEIMKLVESQIDAKTLNELLEMEFPKLRAIKAILNTGNKGQEAAIEWLIEHQEDPDIDVPLEYKIETEEEKKKRLEEAKEKAKKLQAEARRKVAELEKKAEIEREKKRRESGKQLTQVKEQYEQAQRQRERELELAQKKKDREEKAKLKRLLKEDQARRKAERLIKEGKIDEVRELEAEMKMSLLPKHLQTESSDQSGSSSSSAPASQEKKEVTEATIRIRLLDGTNHNCTFKPNDTLKAVFAQASLLMGGNRNFNLIVPPRTTYKSNQLDTSLKDAGLVPRGQIMCSPNV